MAENDNSDRREIDVRINRDWYTTAQAAQYLSTSPAALHMKISRGQITPDCRGGRGKFRSHRFSKATLDAYMNRTQAA